MFDFFYDIRNWSFSGALRGGCVWGSLVEKEYDFKYCFGNGFVYGVNLTDVSNKK